MTRDNRNVIHSSAQDPLRIGFIGAGAVSELHFLALDKIPEAQLVGFYDPDPVVAQQREAQWRVPHYPSAESLLDSHRVDAVFILSPVETHETYALAAIERMLPVFVEKPVAHNATAIRTIREAAEKSGLFVMPGHNYIYNGELAELRRHLQSGDFGRIYTYAVHYTIHHSEELASHYPGILHQVIPHHVYSLLYLGFRPAQVSAMATCLHYQSLDREDQAVLLMKSADGVLGTALASYTTDDLSADPWTFHIKILAERGAATFSWRTAVTDHRRGTHPAAYLPYEDSYYNEAQFFVHSCRLAGVQPLSTLSDAEEVERVIVAAEESINTGRIVRVTR